MLIGLDRQDVRNDETIYNYAAQRMVETGDWLTPRYVDTDGLFLEKPPLKFWLVAVPIRLGWIPNTEGGIRLVDAGLAIAAFGYIMAMGWRIAGVACGAVALALLLAFHSLLFDHGLRENNMESALFLSYVAALFHFVRWASGGTESARRRQALACGLWFVLGFMTKFVAAVFLPLVALAALLFAPGGWRYLKQHWTDWSVPTAWTAALVAPWFCYQLIVHPDDFWATIFGAHVVLRFTEYVDPAHVQPWHFYVTDLWSRVQVASESHRRLVEGNSAHATILAGLAFVLWRLRGPSRAMAGLLLAWWALPLAAISLGTSKVVHYAYPFLPPVALAAGWLCSHALLQVERRVTPRVHRAAGRMGRRLQPWHRRVILLLSLLAIGLALATYILGPVTLVAGGTRVFRNSSALRAIVVAAVLLIWIGHIRYAVRITAVAVLLLLLPLETAGRTVQRALVVDHPLRSAGTCLDGLIQADATLRRGVYRSDPFNQELGVHQLYYSFRRHGPWVEGMERFDTEVPARLSDSARQSPMLLTPPQWRTVQDPTSAGDAVAVRVAPEVVLVLPGPYRMCAAEILKGGGQPFEPESAE